MPPGKEKKVAVNPLNTTAQIQQIFSEVQSQLPTVNFDSDDQNDKNNKLIGTKSYKIDNSKEITPLFISNSKNIKFSSYSIKNI